jgi:hypothetical protein
LREEPFMRILEARFHPESISGAGSVVVGHIHCDGRVARIEPFLVRPETVTPFEPAAVFDKLERCVGASVGDTFHALVRLKSGFWSFAEIPARSECVNATGDQRR